MTKDPRFESRAATMISARMLSPTVRHLTFQTADGAAFPYLPGQWIGLALDTSEGRQKKAYSIASAPSPTQPSLFELAVTRVDGGPLSSALHALEEGACAEVEGPFGIFTTDDAPEHAPLLFVGTGTGVASLRAMIQAELAQLSRTRPVHLLFGCRTEADILFRTEMEALAVSVERFSYTPTLSRSERGWSGAEGYVQTHLPRLVQSIGPHLHVYVCGLSKMVHEVRDVLRKQLGLERKQVHSERFD